ncbi:amino acid ABC transporter [Sesbania bispinosa]|nr:amino acid ABC transporter [Sesbania bispinosa]
MIRKNHLPVIDDLVVKQSSLRTVTGACPVTVAVVDNGVGKKRREGKSEVGDNH